MSDLWFSLNAEARVDAPARFCGGCGQPAATFFPAEDLTVGGPSILGGVAYRRIIAV